MPTISVTVDASKLEKWATELSARGIRNAIRRAVDKSATAARKIALKKIAADIGVSESYIKDSVGKVKRTTQGSLAASFTTVKKRISIMRVSGASIGPGGLKASTHRLGGGGSTSLDVRRAFIVKTAAGGSFVAYRTSGSRLPIKGIYAEHGATAMGQPGGPVQEAWRQEAEKQVRERLGVELQKQLLNEGLGYSAPPDSD
ncbi:phage tail protein [Bradyrhizobium sp. RDM12]